MIAITQGNSARLQHGDISVRNAAFQMRIQVLDIFRL